MSEPVATISYASPATGPCPLCHKRPAGAKMIYGHPVCKKCFYAFANRRQLGYLIDVILFSIPIRLITEGLALFLARSGLDELLSVFLLIAFNGTLMCLYIMKDGFAGASPGKRLCNILVLDDATMTPIGFGQSFKRNSVLLFGLIPFVGGLVSLVIILIIAMQVAKGYRLGDRFAKTRAIWKKFADLPVFGGNALACEQCGYELRGNTSGTCPECGTAVSEQNRRRLEAMNSMAPV